MTGNDQQPTGDPPAAPYRSGAPPQAAAGYPGTADQQGGYPQPGYPQSQYSQPGYSQPGYPQQGYLQAGYAQQGHPQSGYSQPGAPQAAYQPATPGPSANSPQAGYTGGPTASGAAAAWTPADAQRDTGPVPIVGRSAMRTLDPARLLAVLVAALGAVNFLWGFLPEISLSRSDESLSVFAVGPAYVPVLLLIAGLLALAAFLPGSEVSRLAVAAVSVGGAAGAIVSLGTESSVQIAFGSQASKGMGAILLVIFGIIQAVVAIGAYVVGADVPPWLRGAGSGPSSPSAGSRPGGSPSVGSPSVGGSAAGPSAPSSGNPFGRSEQPGMPPAQTGAWSSGQSGSGGPVGPASWGASSASYGSPGQPGGFAAGGYQPPPATKATVDEPATGPQFIVGTETDRSPSRATAGADPQSPASDGSPEEPESPTAAGEVTDAPPRRADVEPERP